MFDARLDMLPESQRRLWDELAATPAGFVLYGGTAIALRLGHRQSRDFDFFRARGFAPPELLEEVRYLRGAVVQQSRPNTLTCLVDRGGEVQVSFFGGLDMNRIEDPETPEQGGVVVASLIDLAATKVKVIQDRASARDYVDIDALLSAGIRLDQALAAARAVYGSPFNPLLSLKALSFFGDGDLETLPAGLTARLRDAVRRIDPASLPAVRGKPGLLGGGE